MLAPSVVYILKEDWPHHRLMREWCIENKIEALPTKDFKYPLYRQWVVSNEADRLLFILRWGGK